MGLSCFESVVALNLRFVLHAKLGLNNQKNGLSRNTSGALGISGLQPKYRFQISQ